MQSTKTPFVLFLLSFLICVTLAFSSQPVVIQAQSTPDPYAGLSIDELIARSYGGGAVTIDQILNSYPAFTRYLIHYPSDGLSIYGFMDIPTAAPRSTSGYPVIIAVHGYVVPASYQTIDYTTGYADQMAQVGYVVLHPNLRNYRPSSAGPNLLRVGFAVDVLNLLAIVRAKGGQTGALQKVDPAEIGLWGHSMGGGTVIRVMTVDTKVKAVLLYAPISGNDQLDAERWSMRAGQYDSNFPEELFTRTSPMFHYDRIQAAISIHHGTADVSVPPEWSAELCAQLQALRKSVECFTYAGQPHTFTATGEKLLMQRTIAFFDKNLR